MQKVVGSSPISRSCKTLASAGVLLFPGNWREPGLPVRYSSRTEGSIPASAGRHYGIVPGHGPHAVTLREGERPPSLYTCTDGGTRMDTVPLLAGFGLTMVVIDLFVAGTPGKQMTF